MPAALRHVDPHRRRGVLYRGFAPFSGTRVGRWVSARVVWKLDPYVLMRTPT